MNGDPIIRKATLADASALDTCIDAAYAQYKLHINDLLRVSEGIAEEIQKNQVWVAV
ncbi:hypothetical protein [Cohaesibacter celericrescens]|uniref:hypothetical protein n=1 Tax=Cohaesibacter celericrescens TaxID=2067669 RepID=UPI001AECD0C9|nr:hypothetical protein [Cohaesibacter celericrescens]